MALGATSVQYPACLEPPLSTSEFKYESFKAKSFFVSNIGQTDKQTQFPFIGTPSIVHYLDNLLKLLNRQIEDSPLTKITN